MAWHGEVAEAEAGGMGGLTFTCNREKLGGTSGEQAIPNSDQTTQPGFQCQANKASNPLGVKINRGWDSGRHCCSLRRANLEGPQGPRTYINPPTLGINT